MAKVLPEVSSRLSDLLLWLETSSHAPYFLLLITVAVFWMHSPSAYSFLCSDEYSTKRSVSQFFRSFSFRNANNPAYSHFKLGEIFDGPLGLLMWCLSRTLTTKQDDYSFRMLCFCCFGRACLIPNNGYLSETAASLVDEAMDVGWSYVDHTLIKRW